MGQKNSKGTVSISNADGRVRLRWRYQTERYSINLQAHNKTNLANARKLAGRGHVRQYSKTRNALRQFDSIKQAAKLVGVDSSTVIGALKGYYQTAGRFIWKYA